MIDESMGQFTLKAQFAKRFTIFDSLTVYQIFRFISLCASSFYRSFENVEKAVRTSAAKRRRAAPPQ